MLCQLNAPEHATITDDVTFRTLSTNWHSHWKHSKSVGFTQNNVDLWHK